MQTFARLPHCRAAGPTLPARCRPRIDARLGFTLIELISILLLVSVLAFTALPRFDLLEGFNAPAYRDQVRAVLQFARKAAVAQRRHVLVATENNGMTLTIASTDPDTGFPADTDITRPLTIPGTSSNVVAPPRQGALNTATTALVFDAQGRPCANGAALAAPVAFTVSDLPVTVEAESGYVH